LSPRLNEAWGCCFCCSAKKFNFNWLIWNMIRRKMYIVQSL
jgi:hypothetical protein